MAPFKVGDLSWAAFGRKEIQLAEHEMPASWPCARGAEKAGRRPIPPAPTTRKTYTGMPVEGPYKPDHYRY